MNIKLKYISRSKIERRDQSDNDAVPVRRTNKGIMKNDIVVENLE